VSSLFMYRERSITKANAILNPKRLISENVMFLVKLLIATFKYDLIIFLFCEILL